MANWVINQGSEQFTARDLAELKQMAAAGRVQGADLIQPPGTSEWLYAQEIPDLKKVMRDSGGADFDPYAQPPQRSAVPIAVVLLLVIAGGLFQMYRYADTMPEIRDLDLLEGEKPLQMDELLVTSAEATLYEKPGGKSIGMLQKDSVVKLLGKRKQWYHVQDEGQDLDGYVKVDHVIAGYQFTDAKSRLDYDPLYNPERYVLVKNASWLQIDEDNEDVTIFQFMLENQSKYDMTDLVLLATIKDEKGKELEKVEIEVEGIIPAEGEVMIGIYEPEEEGAAPKPKKEGEEEEKPVALTDYTFEEMKKKATEGMDEDEKEKASEKMDESWTSGIEIEMKSKEVTGASIDILEVRAVAAEKIED